MCTVLAAGHTTSDALIEIPQLSNTRRHRSRSIALSQFEGPKSHADLAKSPLAEGRSHNNNGPRPLLQ